MILGLKPVRRRCTCTGCGDELYPSVRGIGADRALIDPVDSTVYGEPCGCAEREIARREAAARKARR